MTVDSFRRDRSLDVPVRGKLRLTPHHVFSMRIDAMPLHFPLEHRYSYPSRDEARRVHVHVLL